MANALYPLWKKDLMDGVAGRDLISNTVHIGLLGNGYTYSAAHQFYSEAQAAEIVNTQTNGDGNVVNVSVNASAVVDANDKNIANVNANGQEPITRLVLFIYSGNFATSPLVAYFDTGVTGFPLTPNGSDINVIWNASGIFQL